MTDHLPEDDRKLGLFAPGRWARRLAEMQSERAARYHGAPDAIPYTHFVGPKKPVRRTGRLTPMPDP